MSQILNIILTIIAPIILIAGLGVLLDKTKIVDTRSVSRVVIYLTSPALAFYGMANASIQSSEVIGLFVFSISAALAITILAWMGAVWLKMDRITASAFVLAIALMNMGNYGIPFNEFAFGQPGMERAIVITVAHSLYAYTVGVFLASWGRASIPRALKNVAKVPAPYAAVLGLIVSFGYLDVPELLMRVAGILRGAAIPLMLILLGIQISRVSFKGGQWRVILGASGIRLAGGALVGWLLATMLGLQGVTRQTAIIESSMPTAVIATILATEFESDASLVSGIVLASTLLSVITLSVLLYILTGA